MIIFILDMGLGNHITTILKDNIFSYFLVLFHFQLELRGLIWKLYLPGKHTVLHSQSVLICETMIKIMMWGGCKSFINSPLSATSILWPYMILLVCVGLFFLFQLRSTFWKVSGKWWIKSKWSKYCWRKNYLKVWKNCP